ncbi:MAG TPA: serine/threonine-protein kinase [Paenarthrobacter sp.]|nr:serine/threonine-protein kinase [Paenarthrobacter sp.]
MDTLDTGTAVPPVISGHTPSRMLGRGGSASVWLATRDADGVRFAIKVVKDPVAPEGQLPQQGAAGRILREAGLLSFARHEHLLRVHEVVPVGAEGFGGWGLVMDYAAGGSLANLVRGRGSLGVGETVTVLTPIAQALAFLHDQGIVHGDISPGNVLFTSHGKPLVADLGVAGLLGELHVSRDAGTPGFIDGDANRPGGDARIEPARDVFSLAALGWYCLTGMAPEPARHRPPLSILVPGVPKGLAAALEAGLDPDPRARPNAKELGTAIYRSAAPVPVDLVGSVHESVIPELLTRHPDGAPSTRARNGPGLFRRFRRSRGTGTPARPAAHRLRTPVADKGLPALWPVGPATRSGRKMKTRSPVAVERRDQGSPLHVPVSRRCHPRTRKRLVSKVPAKAVAGVLGACLAGLLALISWTGSGPSTMPAKQAGAGSAASRPVIATLGPTEFPPAVVEALRSSDPAAAIVALSAARDQALGDGHPDLLGLINAPGSPAEAADAALAKKLESQGIRFVGLKTELNGVAVDLVQGDHAVVSLAAVSSGYEERDAQGAVLRWEPPGQPQQLRLVLAKVRGQWLISEVLAPAPA